MMNDIQLSKNTSTDLFSSAKIEQLIQMASIMSQSKVTVPKHLNRVLWKNPQICKL